MKKKFILIIFLILNHCGFTPIYSEISNQNYKFNIVEIVGDNEMNNIVKLEMNKYSNVSSNKNVNIKVLTKYEKKILSKNTTGEATDLQLLTEVEFYVTYNDINRKFNFKEETKTSNMDDQFLLRKYEKTTKKNFINSKIKELILKLSNIK
tara:strand:+ start:84 stop:536 length:453 start_codon:yes stop_codon:yes gene_type:complete